MSMKIRNAISGMIVTKFFCSAECFVSLTDISVLSDRQTHCQVKMR